MRRGSGDDDEGALDSLLDTMTNVVGILVLVLVVTQLGVKDAVTRIAAESTIKQEDLDEAKKDLAISSDQIDELTKKLKTIKPIDKKELDLEIYKIELETNNVNKDIQQVKNERKAEEDRIKIQIRQQQQAANQAKENEKERAAVEKQQKDLLEQLAKLEAQLDNTKAPEPNPAITITIPDPREVGKKKRLDFVVSGNEVFPTFFNRGLKNLDELRAIASKKVIYLAKTQKKKVVSPTNPQYLQKEGFLAEFNKTVLKDPASKFTVRARAAGPKGNGTALLLKPIPNKGFNIKTIEGRSSNFVTMLRAINPDEYFFFFNVEPDSYEAYIAARRVVTEKGFDAGWEARNKGYEYYTYFSDKVRFGPKPPPNPNAKPAKPALLVD